MVAIRLRLPVPPSVNALYYNRRQAGKRGRAKTPAYRKWLEQADNWFLMQKRGLGQLRGQCEIAIRVPPRRTDPSNLIKAAEDFLVSREITGDDRNNHRVSIEVDSTIDCCEIIISPLAQKGA